MSPILLNNYSEELINGALEGVNGILIGRQRIDIVKYEDHQPRTKMIYTKNDRILEKDEEF